MRNAQFVVGLKNSGKSTYCKLMTKYSESHGRKMKIVNLDPTAGALQYTPIVDIRSRVTAEEYKNADSKSEISLGGGFEFVLKYLLEHQEWLFGAVGEGREGDTFIFDCPGELDFYIHLNVLKVFGAMLLMKNFKVCVVFIRDARLATNGYSYISSCLTPLVSYISLTLPHVNVMMKIDMLTDEEKSRLLLFINSDIRDVLRYENNKRGGLDRKLGQTAEIATIILDGHNMVRRKYFLLDIREEQHFKALWSVVDEMVGVGILPED